MGWRVLYDSAGFAWYGGLLFGISALLFQGWWAKIGMLRTLDLAAPGRGHRLWGRAHRVLSFRRRLLWHSDDSALGDELPATELSRPCSACIRLRFMSWPPGW
jgi:hypothetical protein